MDTCDHQVFSVFAYVLKECVWKASEPLFRVLVCHFGTISGVVVQTVFEGTETLDATGREEFFLLKLE